MKRNIVSVIIFCVCSALYSQEVEDRPFITVLDFKGSGVSENEISVFVDFLSSHIVDTGLYRVIDRMQRENILKELEFSISGCTDESCQLEVGKMLQANLLIVGSLGSIADRYILNIKLIEVETGETLKTESEKYSNMGELIDDSENLVNKLTESELQSRGTEKGPELKVVDSDAEVKPKKFLIEAGAGIVKDFDYEDVLPMGELGFSYLPDGKAFGAGLYAGFPYAGVQLIIGDTKKIAGALKVGIVLIDDGYLLFGGKGYFKNFKFGIDLSVIAESLNLFIQGGYSIKF